MQSTTSRFIRPFVFSAALFAGFAAPAFADGSQMLGVPLGLNAPAGTRMIVAGQGVRDGQPANLNITIPAGATIHQVVAYWSVVDWDLAKLAPNDSTTMAGQVVNGVRIGDPQLIFNTGYTAAYRADVTALNLLVPGNNVIAVAGVDFVWPGGAGLVAFVDDGGAAVEFEQFDGNDALSRVITPERTESSIVTYNFAPDDVDRVGNLAMFFSSFFDNTPTVITLSVDGDVQEVLVDEIGNDDGNAFDTVQKDVLIPAGATSLSVQLALEDSGIGRFAGSYTWGKLAWIYAGFSLAVVEDEVGDEGCTPGFWKNHPHLWNGCGDNDVVESLKTSDKFNATFGVTSKKSCLNNCVTLLEALGLNGGGTAALARHAAAALLNAESDINFPYTKDEVIALYRDGVGADAGPETVTSAKDKLEDANELGCPLGGQKPKCEPKSNVCKPKFDFKNCNFKFTCFVKWFFC